jgi:CRP-like cAMP-binding protein
MEQKLLDYFNRISPLSKEETEAISATMNIKFFPKSTILLEEGQISHEAYFVLDGCVKQYLIRDGEEKIINFFTEGQWVVSIQSFSNMQASNHFMACCVDTYLVVGNRAKEEDLYRRFPNLETISRRVMEKVFAEQQQEMESQLSESPEQRYLKLLQNRPNLFQIIPQYQLASYLGIKAESLSRIRKRLASKGKFK